MTPARFQTIEEIFLAVLEQEPEQVSAFLDTACKGDAALRREVEALLASDQRAGRFIETSSVGLATKVIQNQQADSLVGRTIGHYKISESIGTGGMGEVYLATDITAGRKAALKLLPLRFTGDAERLKRFQQEAHAVVGLNHPNILTVYEIGEDHSIHYIASELIEGETLRQRLIRGRIQVGEAVDVAIQVASALAAAHQGGIVHRDIKPENIMLRPDGYAKVLDFGIAKLAEQELPATMPRDEALLLVETNLGAVMGTVRYMSPEQARGGHVDKRTDIWSLGVVLYEMVTGNAPFIGDAPQDVMSSILEKEPSLLTRHVAHVPAELQQIISKTLRKNRDERYHNAREPLKALKDLRHKLEVEAELERSTAAAQTELQMAAETAKQMALEIGHVLFVDIVSYSQLSINEQHAAIAELTQTVRSTEQFREAAGDDRLIKIATGDGMALVFYTSPEVPVRCAMEISGALKQHPRLHIRMGIHSGPVSSVTDVTGHTNLAGAGLNLAQRVMECGDAGHILLSKHVAEDMSEFEQWRPLLHDLGTCEVKHGLRIAVVNLWSDDVGNREAPQKFRALRKRTRVRWAEAAAALLLLVGIVVSFVLVSKKSAKSTSIVPEKSIAVLKFENLSRDPDNAYFAEGIQNEILTRLATVRDLKVISRTSTAKYQSKPDNLKSVAQELGVSTVLEGAVQKAGDKVRVNVQLVDARADRHLWAKSYDRDLRDVLAVESEVSQEIVDALQANLSPSESRVLAAVRTHDTEAYDLFLRGEYEFHQATSTLVAGDAYDRADVFYRQALARDPNFAEAAAGLARSRLSRHWNVSPLAPAELEEVKSLIDRALALAPNSPEAHFSLGLFFYWGHGQYEMALTEFNRTLELQPNNALARQYCASVYHRRGEWERSLADFQRAQELDPLDAWIPIGIGETYMALRLWKDAERAELRALAIDPHNALAALDLLSTRLNATGDVASARRAFDGFPEGINFIDSVVDRGDVARIIDARVYLDAIERRFTDAFQALEKKVVGNDLDHLRQLAGRVALRVLAGEPEAAKSAGEEALPLLEPRLRERPDDTSVMTGLSWVYLAVGRNADALRLSRQAADTISIEKDAFAGPNFQNGLAQIEARAGAPEEAIKRLRHLLSIPAGQVTSIARLKIDPVWDPIRSRPDFQQLLSGPEQIGPNK